MIGLKFDRWTVIADAGKKYGRFTAYLCLCECGTEKIISGVSLRAGQSKSCGCLRHDARRTHGMAGTDEYVTWSHMRDRCLNRNSEMYGYYGGRGITICAQWDSFENFYADMGPKPSPNHSIERIDNNIGYEPGNCKWGTDLEQSNNRRLNIPVTIGETTMNISEWARELNIPASTLYSRIERGATAEEAIRIALRGLGLIPRR